MSSEAGECRPYDLEHSLSLAGLCTRAAAQQVLLSCCPVGLPRWLGIECAAALAAETGPGLLALSLPRQAMKAR